MIGWTIIFLGLFFVTLLLWYVSTLDIHEKYKIYINKLVRIIDNQWINALYIRGIDVDELPEPKNKLLKPKKKRDLSIDNLEILLKETDKWYFEL